MPLLRQQDAFQAEDCLNQGQGALRYKVAEISKDTEQKIKQLQLIEQNLQNFIAQKQQFQLQLIEVESALSELGTTKKAYKIIGNIMVDSDIEELKKDLDKKKEMLDIRLKSFEKQENQMKDKASKLQAEVLKEMK